MDLTEKHEWGIYKPPNRKRRSQRMYWHTLTHTQTQSRLPKKKTWASRTRVNLHISGENVELNKPTFNKQTAASCWLIERGWTLGSGLWDSSPFWPVTLNNINMKYEYAHTCTHMEHSQNVNRQHRQPADTSDRLLIFRMQTKQKHNKRCWG